MKTIKLILLVAAIAFSSVLTASTNPDVEKDVNSNVITQEVGKLLKNPTFLVDHEITADVTLTINKNNEMVVLTVDSEDESVVKYIKARLNYNALPDTMASKTKTFIVPVRLEAELN